MNQIPFRKSWYSSLSNLSMFAATSALAVVFYTSKNTLIRSMINKNHLSVLLFSFALFLVCFYVIAYVVYRLDHVSPGFTDSRQRWVVQVCSLCVLLPMICLQTVYLLYWIVFVRDLRQTEYVERDFVVVLGCLLAIQAHFKIRRLKLERESARKERDRLKEECHEERNCNNQLLSKKKELISRLIELEQREHLWRSYLDMLATPIKASKDGVELEIYASEIQKLYMTETNRKFKNITARLVDGREVVLDYPSLIAFEEAFEYLTFRMGRNLLLCYLAVADMKEEEGRYYVVIRGEKGKEIKVSEERYHALKEIRAWYFGFTICEKAG